MIRQRYAVLIGLALLWACSSPEPDPLLGMWYSSSEPGSAEYFENGTAIIDDGTISLDAAWSRLPDGRIKLEMTILGTTSAEILAVEVAQDRAVFTNSEGDVEVMTRKAAVRGPE